MPPSWALAGAIQRNALCTFGWAHRRRRAGPSRGRAQPTLDSTICRMAAKRNRSVKHEPHEVKPREAAGTNRSVRTGSVKHRPSTPKSQGRTWRGGRAGLGMGAHWAQRGCASGLTPGGGPWRHRRALPHWGAHWAHPARSDRHTGGAGRGRPGGEPNPRWTPPFAGWPRTGTEPSNTNRTEAWPHCIWPCTPPR